MHTIVEASPGSASETVVGTEEHAAAVAPYPYDLQPAQDAPAEPVAEANVPEEERAEVPQPRQWDSKAMFMPVSEVVPAAATVAAEASRASRCPRAIHTDPPRHCAPLSWYLYWGFTARPPLLPSDEQFPICTRNSFAVPSPLRALGWRDARARGSARLSFDRSTVMLGTLGAFYRWVLRAESVFILLLSNLTCSRADVLVWGG
ncbi:hypothetical protein FB451DRAFT_1268103 [Mycena latifolia]|nr:hypothetical protein FB451DRAFT_1268103 [Mycena latifolia]